MQKTITIEKQQKTRATVIETVKPAGYDKKSKTYATKGIVGIALELNDKGLFAIVGSVRVVLAPNKEGKATFKAYVSKVKGYDELSTNFKDDKAKGTLKAAQTYLKARYAIQDKDYSLLVELARKGTPLLTKKEREALKKSA